MHPRSQLAVPVIVGLIVKIGPKISVKCVIVVSDRIMTASFSVHGYNLNFVVVYTPTDEATENIKTRFYQSFKR